MSVAIPVVAIAFGAVTPPQGDVLELRVHSGCTKEVSSFECLLQNFDKKYTFTNPIDVGDNCSISIGRGVNCPLILTGRVEEIEPESTPVENYIRVRGRCWGEKIFRRVVTKTYENKKGEDIVRDLIDYYVGLSHTRTKSDLTSDAASGQKDVVVADASIFSVGDLVKIEDDNAWEYNEVSAVDTVTNTLTMVNNLSNTYTVLANGKVWIDLIEKTDTTYTLLEYKDAKVFDILKYIAESADKAGVIGFDFRVEYDGKFAFFAKNSKNSPISLSEKIEHSRYSKDIHRVRNKIRVYGAAEKPYPLDTDGQPWSDSLTEDLTKPDNYLQHDDGKWEPLHPSHETLSIETTTVHAGSKSVKIQSSSYDYYMGITFTFNSDKYVNGNLYPKLCFTLREDEQHNKTITVGLTDKDGKDCWQHIDISAYNEWQSYALGLGKQNQESWTLGNSEFDWENIKEVRFDFHQLSSQHGVAYVDRMHFGGCRWSATEEDASSQTSYGLRELTETDEELHSDNECSLRGKALLNHLSQPAEFLTARTTCLDYGTDRLLPGDKIHVTLPNENIDSDFRIITVEHRVSARDQTLEITLELGKEKPLLADYLYGLRSTTITVEKLMRTKAGLTTFAGGGGGGGGGMVQHANEWHDPDFLPKDGSESADKIIITDGAGHYLQVPKLTTTERDALTPVNGMIIYNTTTNQFERYQTGAWGAFGGGGGADEKVKVSSDDTTTDFLLQKLLAGTGITLSENNPAGNEKVKIDAHRKWGWADEFGWARKQPFPIYGEWTRQNSGDAIIPTHGSWSAIYDCCALWDNEAGLFYIWYGGVYNGTPSIGLASFNPSTLATTYLNSDNPVLTTGTNFPNGCRGPSVILDGSTYHMAFMGKTGAPWRDWSIFHAYSTNKTSWTVDPATAIIASHVGPSWIRIGDAVFLYVKNYIDGDPDDLKGELWMGKGSTRYTSFTEYPNNPILDVGAAGEWDDYEVGINAVFWNLGVWYVVYQGEAGAGEPWRSGMLVSSNGWSFTRYPWNPIIEPGATGKFDDTSVVIRSLTEIEEKFHVFYAGHDGSGWAGIGYATMP